MSGTIAYDPRLCISDESVPWQIAGFAGMVASLTCWGIQIGVFVNCALALYNQAMSGEKEGRGQTYFMMGYAFTIFFLSSFAEVLACMGWELAWVQEAGTFAVWPGVFTIAVYIVLIFLGDALLMKRAWTVWNYNIWVIISTSVLLAASTATSILYTVVNVYLDSFTFARIMPFGFLSLASNMLGTGLIAGKLLYLRFSVNQILGNEHGKAYTNTVAIIVESAALYTVVAFVYLVMYLVCTPVMYTVKVTLFQVQPIASLLIILRIARKHAVTRAQMSGLKTMNLSQIGAPVAQKVDLKGTDHDDSSQGRLTALDLERSGTEISDPTKSEL